MATLSLGEMCSISTPQRKDTFIPSVIGTEFDSSWQKNKLQEICWDARRQQSRTGRSEVSFAPGLLGGLNMGDIWNTLGQYEKLFIPIHTHKLICFKVPILKFWMNLNIVTFL